MAAPSVLAQILIPLLIGIVAGLIVQLIIWWLRRKGEADGKEKRYIAIIVALVSAMLMALSVILRLAPYEISSIGWCRAKESPSVLISGTLTRAALGWPPNPGFPVQVKVFRAGDSQPLYPEKFANIEPGGRFSAEFPTPPEGNYLINVSYEYDPLGSEPEVFKADLKMGYPRPCGL